MPTTRPRYTVTDTAEVREMLDLAQRVWPDVTDRKQLLLRLAVTGRDALHKQLDDDDRARRRADQDEAMNRAATLMDIELLLTDAAWK